MKKKIIVAGAGHGGLVCAAILAEKGFDVTVYEKNRLKDMGYDWNDTFMINCFDEAGIPRPDPKYYQLSTPLTYTNPSGTVRLRMNKTISSENISIDRKFLISYLIKYAKSKGVKFRFNTQIICPVTDKDRVLGFVIRKHNRLIPVTADLVIDSAGINSPVRSLLPSRFGILNDFSDEQIFTCYRACYERKSPVSSEDRYTVHFFHMKKPGISWIINEENYSDILIGRFGTDLSNSDIKNAVRNLQKHTYGMSEKIVKGGQVTKIPLRRTIPLLVADGYAAIGDCAGMTIPLIGSGIANSIRAGKYLADTVILDSNMRFTAETLWRYQYEYFKNIGNPLVAVDKIRSLCTMLDADDVDYLLEKEILSEKDFDISADKNSDINAFYVLQKIVKAIPKLPMLANATKTLAKIGMMKKVLDEMPKKYDATIVSQWCARYEDI